MYKKDMLVYHLCNEERLSEKYFLDRSYMQGIINSYTLTRNTDYQNQIRLKHFQIQIKAENKSYFN